MGKRGKTRDQAESNIASTIKETNAFARRAKAGSGDFENDCGKHMGYL
ncbi:hypothetical protein ACTWKA_16680 [Bacillus sp. 3A_MP1]